MRVSVKVPHSPVDSMSVKLDTTYQVGEGAVHLDVIIGNAQFGSSLVRLGEEELGLGAIENLKLGNGPDLAGQTLFIKSVVTDISDKTNLTSIRYILKGGPAERVFDLSATVPEEGASIIYRATIQFTT